MKNIKIVAKRGDRLFDWNLSPLTHSPLHFGFTRVEVIFSVTFSKTQSSSILCGMIQNRYFSLSPFRCFGSSRLIQHIILSCSVFLIHYERIVMFDVRKLENRIN